MDSELDGNPGDDILSQLIWKLFSRMEFGLNYRNSRRSVSWSMIEPMGERAFMEYRGKNGVAPMIRTSGRRRLKRRSTSLHRWIVPWHERRCIYIERERGQKRTIEIIIAVAVWRSFLYFSFSYWDFLSLVSVLPALFVRANKKLQQIFRFSKFNSSLAEKRRIERGVETIAIAVLSPFTKSEVEQSLRLHLSFVEIRETGETSGKIVSLGNSFLRFTVSLETITIQRTCLEY